jgi:hypothetical protein
MVIIMSESRFPNAIKNAFLGALIGGLVGGVVGYGLGYVAGRINELTLTGEELEDLYIGFADFAPSGMSTFGMIICGLVAAIGGAVGATVTTVRMNRWAAMVTAALVAIAALLALGIHTAATGHWYEIQIVWPLGSILGACAGAASIQHPCR